MLRRAMAMQAPLDRPVLPIAAPAKADANQLDLADQGERKDDSILQT
jgi:hypothetical protein